MKYNPLPSLDLLNEKFYYDETINQLRFKTHYHKRYIDQPVGSLHHTGYLKVRIGPTQHSVHRLIYYMMKATDDERVLMSEGTSLQVDHINNDKTDNSLDNLRLVTPLTNYHNRKDTKQNGTMSPGYYYQHGLTPPEEAYSLQREYHKKWFDKQTPEQRAERSRKLHNNYQQRKLRKMTNKDKDPQRCYDDKEH
jgi:hypothetical protein